MRLFAVTLLFLPVAAFSQPCAACHSKQVEGYAKTGMGRSLRTPKSEPGGSFEHAKSNTTFLTRSTPSGVVQRMSHDGQNSDFLIEAVIGSGNHASCYVARVGDHLFQSPICFYKRGYDMAPGYEDNPAPGFSRPVTLECLQCHSGKPLPIANSLNRYESPAFAEEAISCNRCHGDTAAHLKRPVRGSIVNPARLMGAVRDSVCEQCHLSGAARVLNPGKSFADFRPGQRTEDVFTTYVAAGQSGAQPLKVVSHVEQMARSRCAIESKGKLWCGTCHDPHNKPEEPAAYFREKCLGCHQGPLPAAHPAKSSNCLPCHMPQREADDGGHTAFTDHWIERRPRNPAAGAPAIERLAVWREPAPAVRARNLGLAMMTVGTRDSVPAMVEEGLKALRGVAADSSVLTGIGSALQARHEPVEAAKAFERAMTLNPKDPLAAESAGMARLEAGDKAAATQHLERALTLDPLLLPDIDVLLKLYREAGDTAKESALMEKVRQAMRTAPKAPNRP